MTTHQVWAGVCTASILVLLECALLTTSALARPKEGKPFTVRVVYIVPSDREPWPEAERRALEVLELLQYWFATQMRDRGYGPKTFEIAKDHGRLVFHTVRSTKKAAEFPPGKKGNDVRAYAQAAGQSPQGNLRCDQDIVVYFCEDYEIGPKGNYLSVGLCCGGSGTHLAGRKPSGEVFLSALRLKFARAEWLRSEEQYIGKVVPDIYNGPLADPGGNDKTFGQLAGHHLGAIGHELGHAFGLGHDLTNDKNRKGNLMGNGFRGMQGFFAPDLTSDFCVLSVKNAALLNKSKYFAVRQIKVPAVVRETERAKAKGLELKGRSQALADGRTSLEYNFDSPTETQDWKLEAPRAADASFEVAAGSLLLACTRQAAYANLMVEICGDFEAQFDFRIISSTANFGLTVSDAPGRDWRCLLENGFAELLRRTANADGGNVKRSRLARARARMVPNVASSVRIRRLGDKLTFDYRAGGESAVLESQIPHVPGLLLGFYLWGGKDDWARAKLDRVTLVGAERTGFQKAPGD